MRVTRKKAIELCLELWTWLAKTGKQKYEWLKWGKYETYNKPKNSATCNDCWFCEYGYQMKHRKSAKSNDKCYYCPYNKKYGKCYDDGTYYDRWENAKTPRTRKKYAKIFLAELKKIT